MWITYTTLLTTVLGASLSSAHIGRGMPGQLPDLKHGLRSHRETELNAHSLQHRASPNGLAKYGLQSKRTSSEPQTEQQEAALQNSAEECKPYNVQAVTNLSKHYPTSWDLADILPGDTQAKSIMQAINVSGLVPKDIQPRGTEPDSLLGKGVQNGYDTKTDPACYWTSTGCTKPKAQGVLPDITTCEEPHTWGYSFDDGPNCTQNALYDAWAQMKQKVSLMYIGSNVFDWPLQEQRGISDGHHICAHTWSHRYMTALTDDQAFAELYYTIKIIKDVMGITVTCWRPPYGDVDDRIRAIAQSIGLRTYMWSGDTNDWALEPDGPAPTTSIEANYASLKSIGTSPAAETGGIIVLEHELQSPSMNMSAQELPEIKKAWKNVVPLSACLNITKPYPENVTYPNFAEYVGGTVMPSGLPTTFSISSAVATPQGTLFGMGGLMATASAGGPDNAGVVSTTPAKSQGTINKHATSRSSGASPGAWYTVPILLLGGALAGGWALLVFL